MVDIIKSGLKYIIDFYRTSPLAESMVLLNAIQIPSNFDNIGLLGLNVLFTVAGISITAKQFRLRKRLEQSVSEHGYDNRTFYRTIPEWCDRQTARVVAENCGHLEDYVALCQANRDKTSSQD